MLRLASLWSTVNKAIYLHATIGHLGLVIFTRSGLRPSSYNQDSFCSHRVRSPSILTWSDLRPFSHGQVSIYSHIARSPSILTCRTCFYVPAQRYFCFQFWCWSSCSLSDPGQHGGFMCIHAFVQFDIRPVHASSHRVENWNSIEQKSLAMSSLAS